MTMVKLETERFKTSYSIPLRFSLREVPSPAVMQFPVTVESVQPMILGAANVTANALIVSPHTGTDEGAHSYLPIPKDAAT
jgi:hypothetical protein